MEAVLLRPTGPLADAWVLGRFIVWRQLDLLQEMGIAQTTIVGPDPKWPGRMPITTTLPQEAVMVTHFERPHPNLPTWEETSPMEATPADVLAWDAEEWFDFLMDGQTVSGTGPVPDSVSVAGRLYIAGTAHLGGGCQIVSDVAIGEGATVGPNAVLQGVSIGPDAVVGAGAVLEDVVVMPGAQVAPLTHHRQCVVGPMDFQR